MNCPLCKEELEILNKRLAHDKLQADTYCSKCEAFIEITYPVPELLEGSD